MRQTSLQHARRVGECSAPCFPCRLHRRAWLPPNITLRCAGVFPQELCVPAACSMENGALLPLLRWMAAAGDRDDYACRRRLACPAFPGASVYHACIRLGVQWCPSSDGSSSWEVFPEKRDVSPSGRPFLFPSPPSCFPPRAFLVLFLCLAVFLFSRLLVVPVDILPVSNNNNRNPHGFCSLSSLLAPARPDGPLCRRPRPRPQRRHHTQVLLQTDSGRLNPSKSTPNAHWQARGRRVLSASQHAFLEIHGHHRPWSPVDKGWFLYVRRPPPPSPPLLLPATPAYNPLSNPSGFLVLLVLLACPSFLLFPH